MAVERTDASGNDAAFDAILAEYLEAAENGNAPDAAAFKARHPQYARQFDEFFADQRRFAQMAAPFQPDGADSSASGQAPNQPVDDRAAEPTVRSSDDPVLHEPPDPLPGEFVRYFGDYELIQEIARGGMGVVYEAKQLSVNRSVALKMILAGQLATDTDLSRFQQEAEAAANLDHPHIVPIYEVGQYKERHYFTMKLVEGGPLSEQLARLRVDRRVAVRIMAQVARAVHFAHQRSILHRDLKPANILLDADDQPHVTDFGLAKRIDRDAGETLTKPGGILGTPAYMSPEQAQGEKQLTTATDIYSLGAILYVLLTGQPPFRGTTPLDVLRQLVDREPASPRTIDEKVPRDLETVCLKCLAKDPLARYASSDALADDLECWLDGKPIHARPITATERLVKWSRRQPLLAGSLATIAVAMFGLLILAGFLWQNAELRAQAVKDLGDAKGQLAEVDQQRQQAEAKKSEAETLADKIKADVDKLQHAASEAEQQLASARNDARRTTYAADMQLAHAAWQTDNIAGVGELIDRYRQPADVDPRGFEWHYLDRRLHAAQLEWKPHGSASVFQPVSAMAISPDGKTLATYNTTSQKKGTIKLWDARDGKPIKSIEIDGRYPPIALTLSDESRKLVAVIYKQDIAGEWQQVIPAAKRGDQFDLESFTDRMEVHTWNVSADEPPLIAKFEPATAPSPRNWLDFRCVIQHEGKPMVAVCVATSPDGKFIAFAGAPMTLEGNGLQAKAGGRFMMWDVVQARVQAAHDAPTPIRAVTFSPDGTHFAIGNHDGVVGVGTPAADHPPRLFVGHRGQICTLHFSDDGSRLYSSAEDGLIIEWDVAAGKEVARRRGHTSAAVQLAVSSDGRTLVSGGYDGSVKVWDLHQPHNPLRLQGHETFVVSLAYAKDGRELISVDDNGAIKTWATADGKLLGESNIPARGALANSLTTNGRSVIFKRRHDADSVVVRNVATGKDTQIAWKDHKPFALALSADDTLAAAANQSSDGGLVVWNIAEARQLATLVAEGFTNSLAFTPGSKLLIAGQKGDVLLWDWQTQKSRRILESDDIYLATPAVAVSADNRLLAFATCHGLRTSPARIRIWDLEQDQLEAEYSGAGPWVRRLVFSPDGRRLVMTGDGMAGQGILKFWDTTSGREVFSADLPQDSIITAVALSPDGHRLAAATAPLDTVAPLAGRSLPAEIHVWDATPRNSDRSTQP